MVTNGDAPTFGATRQTARPSVVFAAVGLTWAAAHGAGLLGGLADLTFILLGTGAVAATILGVRWHRPSRRLPWWLLCGALALFLVGGVARVGLHTLGDLSTSRSILPDLLAIPGYLLLASGLIGLVMAQGRSRPEDADAVLDCVVAALAALTLAWVFLLNPVVYHQGAPLTVRLLLSAYPPMSVFLFAIATRMAFGASARTPAHWYLLSAMGCTLIGDVIYMFVDAHLVGVPLAIVDLPYAVGYVMFSAAVLHPSMRELSEPSSFEGAAPTRPRLAVVAIALAIPAIVAVTRQSSLPGDRIALSSVILALTASAVWRLLRALRAHARAEARLAHEATHDALTELPNRVHVQAHISQVLRAAAADDRYMAVLFLDLDRFKLLNDTLGHSVGDELLVAVTERLGQNLREKDFVARIGGDEFVVVLEDLSDVSEAVYLAQQVRCCLHAPFEVGESEIYSTASVGVALTDGSDPRVDAESLIREADTAMYQAKDGGRDGVEVFDAAMRDRVVERLGLERELRHALERGEFELHFQPIVRLPDAHPVGLEALLRWSHPVLGQVSPARFIPIAEDTGLIIEVGSWVVQEACRQLADWRREMPLARELHVSVNVSARQLRDASFLDTVEAALEENDLPASALALELTESLIMENPEASAEFLGMLRALGVKISIDDFGTGYSSLAYLKRLPVDHVKIDRAFVEDLGRPDSSEESLVAAITAMAGALGMTTVAEGVETVEQAQRLVSVGVGLAQGFFYSRPVPSADVPRRLLELAGVPDLLVLSER